MSDQEMKVRYVIAWMPVRPLRWLAGLNGTSESREGWYVLKYDDEGRQAVLGDPHETPEDAARAAFHGRTGNDEG